jgi:hypothetical protein
MEIFIDVRSRTLKIPAHANADESDAGSTIRGPRSPKVALR